MGRPRGPPAERVRARLRAAAGDAAARAMPSGYQRLGRVLALRLPASLRPWYSTLGRAWQEELGVATVLVHRGPIDGELRRPNVEVVAGSATETEVIEHGVRWRFDAAREMFARGNRSERLRARLLPRPGEAVADLFAGIGYFAIPAALAHPSVRVSAVEKNPEAFHYLEENLERNGVASQVAALLGDNRTVPLRSRSFDRVFLGYLPSSLPWVPRALELLGPEGGWLHLHAIADARGGLDAARLAAETSVRAAGALVPSAGRARCVKPYGPGRIHAVVDLRAVPA
jgi:tRNA wybutosine-synthesizing protein 2